MVLVDQFCLWLLSWLLYFTNISKLWILIDHETSALIAMLDIYVPCHLFSTHEHTHTAMYTLFEHGLVCSLLSIYTCSSMCFAILSALYTVACPHACVLLSMHELVASLLSIYIFPFINVLAMLPAFDPKRMYNSVSSCLFPIDLFDLLCLIYVIYNLPCLIMHYAWSVLL